MHKFVIIIISVIKLCVLHVSTYYLYSVDKLQDFVLCYTDGNCDPYVYIKDNCKFILQILYVCVLKIFYIFFILCVLSLDISLIISKQHFYINISFILCLFYILI